MDIPIQKKKINKTRILIALGVLGMVTAIILTMRAAQGKNTLKIDRDRIIISEVQHGKFQENITASGSILPLTTIYLDALEGGRVEEIFVEDGAILKKGTPILQLSNTDLELSLINQETSVYNLLTQMQISQNAARQNTINRLNQKTDVDNAYREAKREYELNKKLLKKGVIARQDFLASENAYTYQKERIRLVKEVLIQDSIATMQETRQAKNSYTRTRNALELMQRKVSDLTVRAPVDGQLTSLDAEVGESKLKGDRLGQVDVLNGFKVRTAIDEYYINRIYTGQQATYEKNGKEYPLVIKKVYTQVVNGRFEVDMTFSNTIPEGIRRGQSIQLKISLNDEKQSLIVDKGGFFQKTGGNWIFKLNEEQTKAYKIDMQLGSQNSNYYEVLKGLSEGDKVITSSYDAYTNIEEIILQ
ncbi:HlyD family efflux transporter periplasmic adaptor subunit [Aquimarina sp. ERC-38]|uniref:efflux RND transporter periplasmic adaptor subunit n=1 Tax=Aquimarina sp. ERC-38 TaxID=2949996 RepID=UPI00224741E3|nr:HlyD family efflux transporter periplasmic adaptor subunit [Aquimarina sp. ERC-38]UZO81082.1 HlyD family efflux transporter periplasmic adaptor subunit [Aquimarina sp. ERC-38]